MSSLVDEAGARAMGEGERWWCDIMCRGGLIGGSFLRLQPRGESEVVVGMYV